jgi:hypothetical protein
MTRGPSDARFGYARGMRYLTLLLLCAACARREGTFRGDCRDRVDNDDDGRVDCDDPSCSRAIRCQQRDTFETAVFEGDTGRGVAQITYAWDHDGLEVVLDGLRGTGFDLGIAETAAAGNGWFGEDCFNGTAGFHFCHGFSGSSASLASLLDDERTPENVVPGATTLFDADLAFNGDGTDRLTYMITLDDGSCETWGDDVEYYASFACVAFR